MIYHNKYKAYIFDLDNTLYDEVIYLHAAYYQIAVELEKKFGTDVIDVASFLNLTFGANGRKNLFNSLIENFNLPGSVLETCLTTLRTVQLPDKINLTLATMQCLKRLIADNKKIFVLTNGNVLQQKNKVAQINWNGLHNKIQFYYANELEAKPSPAGIFKIIAENDLIKSEILFIGDDEVDRLAAEAAEIEFVWKKDFNCN